MLLGVDDVCATLVEKCGDGGDDPGPVHAGDEEADAMLHGVMSTLRATVPA